MQPKSKLKKTLVASALILGLGSAFHAYSDTFTATIQTISDVTFTKPVAANTEINFGLGIKGTATGEKCKMNGKTGIGDINMLFDVDRNNANTAQVAYAAGNASSYGYLDGNACVAGGGDPLILQISGTEGALVSVNVPNFNDGEISWTPTDESCVVDFDGATTALGAASDQCRSLENNTLTAIGIARAAVAETDTGNIDGTHYAAAAGATRMVISGEIEILSALTAGAEKAVTIDVLVTYE